MRPTTPHRVALAAACLLLFPTSGCAAGGGDRPDGSFDDSASPFDAGGDAPSDSDSGLSFDTGSSDSGHSMDSTPPNDTGVDTAPPVDTGPPADTGGADTSVPDSASGSCDSGGPTCPSSGFSGVLATFDLTGQTGSEASAPATSTACGLGAGDLTRAATITAVSGKDSINGSGWGTGASADATRYYTLTLTPVSGCSLDLTSIDLDVRASGTGPTTGDVATSADGFASYSSSFVGTSKGTTSLSATGSGPIEVRIYGYGATSSGGTLRIQNTLTVSGSIL